MHDLGTRLTS